MTNALAPYRRITIKIGSALLVDGKTGKLRADWLASLASDLNDLRKAGCSLVIVSSGAIALGRRLLHLDALSLPLDQSQAAASAGQIALSQAWAGALGEHGIVTGQILLTPNITEERRYFLNARTTIATLLGLGAVPIINENDSVATAEIRYGDNDRLSARVATMIEADCLILLSDIDGLYTAPPAKSADATHLPHVAAITPEIEAMAGGAASHLSRGGMTTKIEAGKIATLAGTAMVIAKGTENHPLRALTEGARHTLFAPAESRAQARKRWIMGTLDVAGSVHVDAGAARALLSGKSLLPIGVTSVKGDFHRGDAVAIVDPDGREIARGLAGLGREEADLVKGKNSARIEEILGALSRSELVHRDNMVVLMGLEGESLMSDLKTLMHQLGINAVEASSVLAFATSESKHLALVGAAQALDARRDDILSANALDMAAAETKGISRAFLDRLKLNDKRIDAMIEGLRTIAELPDPVGEITAEWTRPNGMTISRVRTPLGVIGVIFESRPNVTADAGALTLKSGNAVILRGGSDSVNSSRAIHACLVEGLKSAGLPEACIQIVPTTDREAVGEMLRGLDGAIDVIVPRGGKTLVARVQDEARVPVFAHLEGICHTYIDESADLQMAIDVTVNAKMRRTGVCGATETLLIHENLLESHGLPVIEALIAKGCEIRGDAAVLKLMPTAIPATEADWHTEYEDAIISVKVVKDVAAAIAHISHYSSHHTEAIITENPASVERFFAEIDSAILLHNASTQFADGGEFGFGGEIGIATGKFHARGPVGVEQLTSFKYLVRGDGQTRP